MTLHPIWNIRPRNSQDKDWVEVIKDSGCYSWVGRQKTRGQQLSLGKCKQTAYCIKTKIIGKKFIHFLGARCYSKKTIQHEFIHALGFHHEQNRPDRNDYVTINWKNIGSDYHDQFIIEKTSLTFDVPYDGKSIMHYKPRDFSINPSNLYTIESKVKNKTKLIDIHILKT